MIKLLLWQQLKPVVVVYRKTCIVLEVLSLIANGSVGILPIRSGDIVDGFCSSAAVVYTAHHPFQGI